MRVGNSITAGPPPPPTPTPRLVKATKGLLETTQYVGGAESEIGMEGPISGTKLGEKANGKNDKRVLKRKSTVY